jgi:M6 family metalloprotease-like protein
MRPRPTPFALAAAVAGMLAGCVDAPDQPPPPPTIDEAIGDAPLEHHVACGADGESRDLWLPAPAVDLGDGADPDTAALGACSAIGPQPIAVLYVTWPDATGQQATIDDVRAAFFAADDPSLRGYWEAASYGLTTATGDVFGPYLLAHPYTCSPADLAALQVDAIAAADADVDFTRYTRVVIVSPQGPDSGCAIMGQSQIGCSAKSSPGDGAFTASVSTLLDWYMVPRARGAALAAHELGHALGLGHGSSLDFDLDAAPPVGKAGFGTISEYGDPYSVMGNAGLWAGHYAAPHKARLGWLDGRYATVESGGTYHLDPYAAAAAGVQALKVRRAAGVDEWLWLEQRTAGDAYDGALDPQAFDGPLVHLQSSATDLRSYLLDLAPATTTFRDGALVAGAPFAEPYSGMILEASALGPAGVDVTVTYGPSTCTVTSPLVTIAPASQVTAAGAGVAFTVSVTNQDAASCPTGTFQLTALRPSGWSFAFAPTPLRLAPGETGTTTLTITPPASAAVGATGAITARSYRYGWMGNANASVFVCGAGAAPTVTMTPATATVEASFPRSFTVTVRNHDCAARTLAPIASVPAGWTGAVAPAALTLAAGASGTFTLTATSPASAAAGSYPVGASVDGASASATLTLTAARTRVTTAVLGAPFKKGQALTLQSTVTFGSGPAPAGAAVTFYVTRPNGATATVSATTSASGVATATYTPPQPGSYSVYSVASYPAGTWTASASVPFSVGS